MNEEGGCRRTLPEPVLGSDGVFSTVREGGFANLQTKDITSAVQSEVRCDLDLPKDNHCVRLGQLDICCRRLPLSLLTTTLSLSHSTSGKGSPEISHMNRTLCPSSTFWERGCSRK